MKRRNFIKLGATLGSGLILENYTGLFSQAMELATGANDVSRSTLKLFKGIPTTCLNCYDRCGITGFIDYGRLVNIGGNPAHPNSRGRICAKGVAGINIEYDPDRVLSPLKRVGSRGSGKWKKITTEEAYEEIAAKLDRIRQGGRLEEFVYQSSHDITTTDISTRFAHAFGSPSVFISPELVSPNKAAARNMFAGAPYDIPDVANANLVVLFGANPYESGPFRLSLSQRIIDAKNANKAKVVVFDVRLTQTSGTADEWYPVAPGTDGIVALAIANIIVREELFDRNFIEKWTNVRPQELAEYLKQFSPLRAERESGVPATTLRRLAIEFASMKPSIAISGGGVTEHANGVENERCVMLLNAIIGNIEVKGGSFLPRTYELRAPAPAPPVPTNRNAVFAAAGQDNGSGENGLFRAISSGKIKTSVYMSYASNPAYSAPANNSTRKVLADEKLIPFSVAVDSFMTETATLADIVIPSATYLERWEVESPPSFEMVPIVSLRQPVVKPLGESVSVTDFFLDLSRRLKHGMEKYMDFASSEEYVQTVLSSVDRLAIAGGFDYLREHGVWFDPVAAATEKTYETAALKTPSGKFEIAGPATRKNVSRLPSYKSPEYLSSRGNDKMVLSVFERNVHTHGRTQNSMWLSEIAHANEILINADSAARLGIEDGDTVEVSSSAGKFEARARLTQGIHRKSVAIAGGGGHWAYGRIARAVRFKSDDPETTLLWWGEEGGGVSPNSIIPDNTDPAGGGQSWMGTEVRVRRIGRRAKARKKLLGVV